jgi:hypothetical protein
LVHVTAARGRRDDDGEWETPGTTHGETKADDGIATKARGANGLQAPERV